MTIGERIRLRINEVTHRVNRMPVLVLMPHSACNCRCVMCDIWRANKNRQEIDAELIRSTLSDLRSLHVRWVVLSGGEALMHSNLSALCEALATLEARMTLLSTGLLLRRNLDLIRERFDEVILSLDGSEGVHDDIRNVPRAFERLADGVAALRRHAPDVEIGARCVLQRRNFHDLGGVIETAKALQLDWISFLAADVSSEAFNRPGGWTPDRVADVSLTPAQCDELEQILSRCFVKYRADFESGFIAENPQKLERIVAFFRAMNGDGPLPRQRCNAPWVSAVVEPGGAVRPCYFHEAYGTLAEGGLARIVNSRNAIDFRRKLDVNKDPICRRCVCSLVI